MCCALADGCANQAPRSNSKLPAEDISFLRDMTRNVVEASRVKPGSNGGGNCPLTNTCGFTLITPGKDTYQAFWPRDFSMALYTGFISKEEMRNHLNLLCGVQNGENDKKLAHGLHVPPWAIPDHVNYDGQPVWFPGSMSSGADQGNGICGRIPPLDNNYEFIHIAFVLAQASHDTTFIKERINGRTISERLQRAFAAPAIDDETGLVQTTEQNRAVGFGFCDAETHTGKLLFASLLRYRAARELERFARASANYCAAAGFIAQQSQIRANLAKTFSDPTIPGWLRASTGASKQPDVWGTLYALKLGVLDHSATRAARKAIAEAVRNGTITFEGGVRHVPTNFDFSASTSWERSIVPVNTYQNGAYWHTASGWLIDALWKEDRALAVKTFEEMIAHLRDQDFRKGPGHGAPWECFGRNGQARQNPVYMASVALPYSDLKWLAAPNDRTEFSKAGAPRQN